MKHPSRLIAALLLAAVFAPATFAQIYWTNQSPAGVSDDIWGVTYANGTFAATTTQGRVLTSADGLTWASQVADPSLWLVSIAYGNGTWVTVGAGGTILVSTDLKTWVNAKSATSNKLNGVLYTGSLWVAVGDSATVITSPDSLNWTVQTVPANLGVSGFLHGITLAPGSGPAAVLISGALAGNGTGPVDTGVVLQMSLTPASDTQNYPISSVGIGNALTGNSANVIGNLEAVLAPPSVTGVATIALGWEGTITTISGGSGQEAPGIPSVIFRGLAYGAGYWVAAGEQGTILTSTDGLAWTQRFSGDSPASLSTATFLGAAYSPTLQRFVLVGTGGTILVSNPAPTVFANVSTRGLVSNTQTFIGGFVIEGTAPRTVLIRADGPVLTQFGVANALPDPVLTVFDNSQKVVATNTGWATNMEPASISTAALTVGAFALPNPSPDSALLLTLQPGAYTAVITSAGGNSGTALFEAYTD